MIEDTPGLYRFANTMFHTTTAGKYHSAMMQDQVSIALVFVC